jgi:hypothetical protein
MSDPFLTYSRLAMLIFPPLMLAFPWVFAILVPNRVTENSGRIQVRGQMQVLALSTMTLLAIWLGLVLASLNFPLAFSIANFWWGWFFPLWFLFAMPAIAAKNPTWSGNSRPAAEANGLRTASLVNRERRSPVTRAMWLIPISVYLLFLVAIAARGLMPFPAGDIAADTTAEPAVSRVAAASAERFRWLISLAVYGGVFGFLLALLPYSLRLSLIEAEPLDAAGSVELAELYERQRRKRVLGLFWGSGVLLPFCLGLFGTLQIWYPDLGSLWGLVGGIGGTLLGIAGALFGIQMTIERARIAELRVKGVRPH